MSTQLTTNLKEPLVLPESALSPVEMQIAERYALGDSITKISDRYELEASIVRRILREPAVSEYITQLVEAINTETLTESKRLISRMIRDKVEQAEKDEISLGETTRKDIPDLLKMLQDIEKAGANAEGSDSYITIIQQMTGGK